jgi:hypothetical protein
VQRYRDRLPRVPHLAPAAGLELALLNSRMTRSAVSFCALGRRAMAEAPLPSVPATPGRRPGSGAAREASARRLT